MPEGLDFWEERCGEGYRVDRAEDAKVDSLTFGKRYATIIDVTGLVGTGWLAILKRGGRR